MDAKLPLVEGTDAATNGHKSIVCRDLQTAKPWKMLTGKKVFHSAFQVPIRLRDCGFHRHHLHLFGRVWYGLRQSEPPAYATDVPTTGISKWAKLISAWFLQEYMNSADPFLKISTMPATSTTSILYEHIGPPRQSDLPEYANELHAYHRAHAAELRQIIADLPLKPGDRILDVACGDGTYSGWLAKRVAPLGTVVGLDSSLEYLQIAQAKFGQNGLVTMMNADIEALPLARGSFDLVWCAQSLVSLPEPTEALRRVAEVVKPGGHVAVLENDSMHQLLLPWPADLELAVREAELAHYRQSAANPDKRYIGRRLASILRQSGLTEIQCKTYATNRIAPLDVDERNFLVQHLNRLRTLVVPHLNKTRQQQFDRWTNPTSLHCMLDRPDFQATWLDFVSWGRKPINRKGT